MGPVVMMLGGFAFEALGFGFDGLQRQIDTSWASIEVAQAFDAQQWVGPKSDEVTIKGVLFPAELGGQASLNGLTAAALAGEKLMFVSGSAASGQIHGYFTIQGVSEDRSFIDRFGTPRRNAYSITLKRYGSSRASMQTLLGSLLSLFG
jgi:phage protein U